MFVSEAQKHLNLATICHGPLYSDFGHNNAMHMNKLILKGGGHEKITADFFGQIFSLSSVKTENIIFKIFGIH